MEYLKLVKGDDIWVLPDNAWISGIPFTVRRKENARALQHGIIDSGDGKVGARTVALTIIVDEPTSAEYFATLDMIKGRLYRRDQRLYMTETRYIKLTALYQYKEEFIPARSNRTSTVSAEFKSDDPFFYDDNIASESVSVGQSPETLIINNIGNVDTPPIITVEATGMVPSIQITNNANGRTCLYRDPQLIAGQTLIIDTALATVERNEVNTINNYLGAFHILEPGENEFSITCDPACTVTVSYYPRWL